MRRRKDKQFRAEARVPLGLPTRANQLWTMDFTQDQFFKLAEVSDAEPDGWRHARSARH